MKSIRIATRNSPLALWQANYVKQQLEDIHAEISVEIVPMTTRGDQLLDRSLSAVGGKGLFLKELEVSLLNKETDIAVHSMKDVPVDLPRGLEIPVVCEREDARDAFVSEKFQNLWALPKGSRVGTASLRRVAQLKNAFPDLEFAELRGNVNTRLAKLDQGDYDAIILAAAGLIRLGFHERIKQYITSELCLPAVGQGIVGIECRSDDEQTKALLAPLHSKESAIVLTAERAMNAALEGGCQVPVAGYAQIIKGKIRMRGLVGKPDGTQVLQSEALTTKVSQDEAQSVGDKIARQLLAQGAGDILSEVYRQPSALKQIAKPMVILTRQTRYLGNSAAILQRLDFQATHIPTLSINKSEEADSLQGFSQLKDYTDILFVSRNAVEIGMPIIENHGGIPQNVNVMAMGGETAKQLYQYNIDAMFPSQGTGAEALLKVSQLKQMSGRRVLVVRGEQGLTWPLEEMRSRGAVVDQANCYTQTIPEQSAALLDQAIEQNDRVEGVFIHSVESLHNFVNLAEKHLTLVSQSKLVAGSQRIADTAQELNWLGEIRVAESPSNKHMMIAFSD